MLSNIGVCERHVFELGRALDIEVGVGANYVVEDGFLHGLAFH